MGEIVKKDQGPKSAGDTVLALIRTKHPEYHPLLAIAEMAHDASIDDPRLKLDCHKTLAKYVIPELKSVEVKGEIDVTHRRVIVSMFDGEIPGDGRGIDLLTEQVAASDVSDADILEETKKVVNE